MRHGESITFHCLSAEGTVIRQLTADPLLVLAGGILVDYQWFGLGLSLCAYWWCRTRSPWAFVVAAMSLAGICWGNGNLLALYALPVLAIGRWLRLPLRRSQWGFYVVYPAHLLLLGIIRVVV